MNQGDVESKVIKLTARAIGTTTYFKDVGMCGTQSLEREAERERNKVLVPYALLPGTLYQRCASVLCARDSVQLPISEPSATCSRTAFQARSQHSRTIHNRPSERTNSSQATRGCYWRRKMWRIEALSSGPAHTRQSSHSRANLPTR